MTEDLILQELRTIRSLLAIDKEDYLKEMIVGLDHIHSAILSELNFESWKRSEEFKSELVEEFDVAPKTIQRRMNDLIDQELVEIRGSGRGTEYRNSSLYRAAKMMND